MTDREPCVHPRIQAWRFLNGESAGIWSCMDCAKRFEPIERSELIRERLEQEIPEALK